MTECAENPRATCSSEKLTDGGRPTKLAGLSFAALIGVWSRVAVAGFLTLLYLGFIDFVSGIRTDSDAPEGAAGGIVVLTGGPDRLSDGLDLLARGYSPRMLITGVNQATSGKQIQRIAPSARSLLDCCVDLGYLALNTAGNAVETRNWVAQRSVSGPLIVVTSSYHMPRALAELADALPDRKLIPYPVVTDRQRRVGAWGDSEFVRHVAIEYFKYLVARARMTVTAGSSAT